MSRQPDAHESYAVAAGTLHWAAAILALSLLAIVLLVYTLARPLLTGGATVRPVPPLPRLQPNPTADLAAERSLQQSRLDGYRWMDEKAGIARIPITRAMALLAAQPQAAEPAPAAAPVSVRRQPARSRQTGHRVAGSTPKGSP